MDNIKFLEMIRDKLYKLRELTQSNKEYDEINELLGEILRRLQEKQMSLWNL